MMMLLDISLISKLTTRNRLILLFSAYPMKIVSTVLGPIFSFLQLCSQTTLNFEELNVRNSPFPTFIASNIGVSLGNPIEYKTGRKESFTPKVSGAPELSNMQFTMFISVLFFLSATPLD